MTDQRRPIHVPVLVGASASLYAASLAVVATLQSATDRATIEYRAPAVAAAARLDVRNDALGRRLDAVHAELDRGVAAYDDIAADVEVVSVALDELAAAAADVAGRAAALPDRVALPAMPAPVAVVRRAPTVHATTGASGG